MESLEPHNELIALDSSNTLRLKQRHRRSKPATTFNVKGHTLSELTMSVAVPAINIAIYVNPVLASLAKAALITVTIDERGTPHGNNRTHCFYSSISVSSENKGTSFIFTVVPGLC